MSQGDIIGLVLSYGYAFGLLFGVEAIGKRCQWQQWFTRKIIHVGAGMWIWGILYFFDHWYYGIIPFATFIVLNYIFYRQQSFKAMDDAESTPGTVYFAISITVLFGLLWRTGGAVDRVPIAVAAIMAMTLGDGFACIVGKSYGEHKYVCLGHARSWQGTAAMALFSFGGIFLSLLLLPSSALSPNSVSWGVSKVLALSLLGTTVATVAEGITPVGMDNLSVPLLTGSVLYLFSAL